MLNSGIHIDYFHLISGHDYPGRSGQEFDQFFEAHNGRSFMHYDTTEQHIKWKDKIDSRFTKWNLRELKMEKHIKHWATLILDEFFIKKVPCELYAGWNWFSWHGAW